MNIDMIGLNIMLGYCNAQMDVEALKASGVPDSFLRQIVEGHFIEMSWELHGYLWNQRDGCLETPDSVIVADNEGGIRGRMKDMPGWFVYLVAKNPVTESSATEYVRNLMG